MVRIRAPAKVGIVPAGGSTEWERLVTTCTAFISSIPTDDAILPAPKLAALGLQHEQVMYAGAVAAASIISPERMLRPTTL